MVLTRSITEKRHDPVTKELVHRPTMLVHDLQHDVKGSVNDFADRLGVELLGQGREAGDIQKERSNLFALTAGAQQVAASAAVLPAGQPLMGAPETPRRR